MARFRDLISEGKIGDIHIGMPLEAVEKILRPADDRSVKSRPIEILKFGSLELTFKFMPGTSESHLVAIAIYFSLPNRKLPPYVVFDDWTPTSETTEADVRDFLGSAGLHVHTKVAGENKSVIVDSGASIVFDDDRLHSVHFHRANTALPDPTADGRTPTTSATTWRS